MAEEFLRKEGFEVISAGTKLSGPEQPLGQLRPALDNVLEVMKELGFDISNNIRKSVTPEMVEWADKVILVVDDTDPVPQYVLDSDKVIRWNVLDPKGQDIEFTRKVRDQIIDLVRDFGQ